MPDVPNRVFPSAAGPGDLAHKLERALEQIEELQERVERLEGGGAEGRDAD
ncbi:hypothetical protein J7E96_02875 [Streptomyces sp. ISL-96]|uniref:hypothetical protein n=1 Tax=Streptomyces sp. ISL-96 TaxID=2819191 RepID=UPI001BEC414F|nr:hypothetical protein [Streptomyces sp. ISL-96]MBT2487498.1 hypothetical protein [Streptomyces sp. ISL-96]